MLQRPKEWEKRFAGRAQNFGEHARAKLADILQVPESSFVHFPLLGAHNEHRLGPCFVHPEVDADLRITGASLRIPRAPKGQDKPSAAGSKRGLTVPLGWKERPGSLHIVEGLSDTIAGTAGWLAGIGRPGVAAGLRLVADFIEKHVPPDRMIVIVGENDERLNSKKEWEWPGKDKALKFAQDLSAEIGRPVHICFPPNTQDKDLRAWATRLVADGAFWSDIADRWVQFTKPVPVEPSIPGAVDGTFAAAGPEGKSGKADGRGGKAAPGAVDPSGAITRGGLDKKGDSDSAGKTPTPPARWEATLDDGGRVVVGDPLGLLAIEATGQVVDPLLLGFDGLPEVGNRGEWSSRSVDAREAVDQDRVVRGVVHHRQEFAHYLFGRQFTLLVYYPGARDDADVTHAVSHAHVRLPLIEVRLVRGRGRCAE